ncbi:membrane protein [Deinococcus aetherius]|uniref:Membrane protein n=1 Tax=Deinococcus aetherius TaxID=200252 RepID=A0ABN6RHF2_9DEIO|nr:DMT family transporter [Deinococcus aetherius]BDP41294.1 membrane protein [Deinococcus aetherius]
MSPRDLTALLVLSALWGGSFLFMRIAAPVLGPVVLIELRVLIAGLALLTFAVATRSLPSFRVRWRQFLVIGVVNSALPFLLISAATVQITASLAATLNATTPLFGALVAAVWLGERLSWGKGAGLLLGLMGVALLVGFGPLPLTSPVWLSIGASLLGALSYGVAAVYTKLRMTGVPPFALALYSQLCAAVVLLPAVPFALPTVLPSGVVILSVLALALLSTAVAYLLYFGLIQRVGPTRATTVTYLSPAFGIVWGALLLREPLTLWSFLGFGLILASVALVTGPVLPGRQADTQADTELGA